MSVRDVWLKKCYSWKTKWPVVDTKSFKGEDQVDLYSVIESVNALSDPSDIIMGDAGSISYAGPVALKAKQNGEEAQRLIFSQSQADMGWGLPASIGVSIASKRQVIAIIGDGSFMSNIQELAVVREHWLNIKFVLLNNNGYLSIRNTQNKFYEGREYGTSSKNGLWFPDFKDIAESFEMGYYNASTIKDLEKLSEIFKTPGPYIIDCRCKYDQQILPSQAFKNGKQAPLHDMFPFLSDEELQNEMIDKSLL